MGNNPAGIQKSQFTFEQVIGKGGFGHVWRVHNKKLKTHFALKEMQKATIVFKKRVFSVMNERKILEILRHPLLVNMHFAFQDVHKLYLILDMKSGGDLRYHMSTGKRFSEEEAQFILACLIIALEYIHFNGFIHKDIKPENVVFDLNGYPHITDFGIARSRRDSSLYEKCGSLGYMAPEIMCTLKVSFECDFFALGVILHELIVGYRPYRGSTFAEVRDAILCRKVALTRHKVPEGWSAEAIDFTNKLLERKSSNRLGTRGAHQLKQHAWMRNVKWNELFKKTLKAPFVPERKDNFSEAMLKGVKNNDKGARVDGELFKGYDFIHLTEKEVRTTNSVS